MKDPTLTASGRWANAQRGPGRIAGQRFMFEIKMVLWRTIPKETLVQLTENPCKRGDHRGLQIRNIPIVVYPVGAHCPLSRGSHIIV